MCARKQFEALVPVGVATLLEQAFRASRRAEGPVNEAAEDEKRRREGCLLGRLARHFKQAWGGDRMPARTVSKRQRRKYPRCCIPACRRALGPPPASVLTLLRAPGAGGHHIVPRLRARCADPTLGIRSREGSEDPSTRLPMCLFHHLVVVHGGIAEILGIFPDGIEYRVKGTEWRDAQFGRKRGERV